MPRECEGPSRAVHDGVEHVPVIAHVPLLTRLGRPVHDAREFAAWKIERRDVAPMEADALQRSEPRDAFDGGGWVAREDYELRPQAERCIRVRERFGEP